LRHVLPTDRLLQEWADTIVSLADPHHSYRGLGSL